MKQHILLFVFLMLSVAGFAQFEQPRPCRTPEEEALKQTEMLQRELSLTEQQRDTIYRIHLKYAQLRQVSNTRAEGIERMNAMVSEVLGVLTKKQQDLFLNKQMGPDPRRMQMQHGPRTPKDTLMVERRM